MLLLLEVQGRALLVVKSPELGQLPTFGVDDLVGLIETSRQLPFATLMALDQLETGAGGLRLPTPECLQLFQQTRLLHRRTVDTDITCVTVRL